MSDDVEKMKGKNKKEKIVSENVKERENEKGMIEIVDEGRVAEVEARTLK